MTAIQFSQQCVCVCVCELVFVCGERTGSLRWSFDRFFLYCPLNQRYLTRCAFQSKQCVCGCECLGLCVSQRKKCPLNQNSKPPPTPSPAWVLFDRIYFYGCFMEMTRHAAFSCFTKIDLLFVTPWCTEQRPIKISHRGQSKGCKLKTASHIHSRLKRAGAALMRL